MYTLDEDTTRDSVQHASAQALHSEVMQWNASLEIVAHYTGVRAVILVYCVRLKGGTSDFHVQAWRTIGYGTREIITIKTMNDLENTLDESDVMAYAMGLRHVYSVEKR